MKPSCMHTAFALAFTLAASAVWGAPPTTDSNRRSESVKPAPHKQNTEPGGMKHPESGATGTSGSTATGPGEGGKTQQAPKAGNRGAQPRGTSDGAPNSRPGGSSSPGPISPGTGASGSGGSGGPSGTHQ